MSDLYVFTGPGTCRACDAPLLWFRTPRGKNMPVDDCKEVSPDGLLEKGATFTIEQARTQILPNVHWKTCSGADRFRRK